MNQNKKEQEWKWIEIRILAEKNKHEIMGNNEWAKIAAIKINSQISAQIQRAREEGNNKALEKVGTTTQAYQDGYNACLKDFKIKNDYGEKSL